MNFKAQYGSADFRAGEAFKSKDLKELSLENLTLPLLADNPQKGWK